MSNKTIRREITEGIFIAGPVIGHADRVAIAAVFLGTINFGFGGRAKFGIVFAVIYYAWLPWRIKVLLGVMVIYAGMAPESFNITKFCADESGRLSGSRGYQQGAIRAGDLAGCRDHLDAGAD